MISVTLLAVLSGFRLGGDERVDRAGGRSGVVRVPAPFLEFAPADGTGMGSSCACAAVTTKDGTAVTFTRASTGTCMTGGENSLIANSSMVTCAVDAPRVMPGGDGAGSKGLLSETAATNTTIRSEEFNNAAWSGSSAGGPAAPTVGANAAVAPDGTTTAERLQIPATGVGQYSAMLQVPATGACAASSTVSATVYIKGNGTSGTTDLFINDGAGGTNNASCAFVPSTWTRCRLEGVVTTAGAGSGNLLIGNLTLVNGGIARDAVDVFMWGAQCEVAAKASSYVKTEGTSQTRAVDLASVASTIPSGGLKSWSATYIPHIITATAYAVATRIDANNEFVLGPIVSNNRCTWRIGGTLTTQDASSAPTLNVENSGRCYYDGSDRASCLGGTCNTTASSLTLPGGAATVYLGRSATGTVQTNGIIKKVCLGGAVGSCT